MLKGRVSRVINCHANVIQFAANILWMHILHFQSYFRTITFFLCCPFAGLPNALGEYDETPEIMSSLLKVRMTYVCVYVYGGICWKCGFIPRHSPQVQYDF